MSDTMPVTNYVDFYTTYQPRLLNHLKCVSGDHDEKFVAEAAVLVVCDAALVDSAAKRHALTVQLLDDLQMDTLNSGDAIKSLHMSEPYVDDNGYTKLSVILGV